MTLPKLPWLIPMLSLWYWAAYATEAPLVAITTHPAPAYIERTPTNQHVSIDFVLENLTNEKLTLDAVELSVFDRSGALVLRRFIDDGGTRPSIETLTKRVLEPQQKILLFNPFHTFEADVELAPLRYTFSVSTPAQDREHLHTVTVVPAEYVTKTHLQLPISGRQLVYDGHDFYAHHRRFDYEFGPIKSFGFRTNFMRYSYDFVPVDAQGTAYRGDEKDNRSYLGFGAPLRAAGAGRVIVAVDDQPDNRRFDESKLTANPMVLFGNYLVLDHGNGEFSLYAHLQQGSLSVKIGDAVRLGQVVAKIGASGSANFPHLHYELQNGSDTRAEGLPSYFEGFTRWLGKRAVKVKRGLVGTGDIVEAP